MGITVVDLFWSWTFPNDERLAIQPKKEGRVGQAIWERLHLYRILTKRGKVQ
jgi:hypothetical protein